MKRRTTRSINELPETRSSKRNKVEDRCKTPIKAQSQPRLGTPTSLKDSTPSRKRKPKLELKSEQNGHLSESEDNKVEVSVKKKQKKSNNANLKTNDAGPKSKGKTKQAKKLNVQRTTRTNEKKETRKDKKKTSKQKINDSCIDIVTPSDPESQTLPLPEVKIKNLGQNVTPSKDKASKKTRPSRTPKKSSKELTEDIKAKLDDQYGITSTVNKLVKKEEPDLEDTASGGDESEDDTNWEDVQESEGHHGDCGSISSTACRITENKNVEISIPIPGMKSKRKKDEDNLMTKIQKAMTRFKKQIQLDMHKAHLVTLISWGFNRNTVCNQPILQAYCLSYVPSHLITKAVKKWQSDELTNLLTWFKEEFPPLQQLRDDLSKSDIIFATSYPQNMAEVLVILLRALGILTRLVSSLQPVSMKIYKDSKTAAKKNTSSKKLQSSSSSIVEEEAESTPQGKTSMVPQSEKNLVNSDAESKPRNSQPKNMCTNLPTSTKGISIQPTPPPSSSTSPSSSSSQSKAASVKNKSKQKVIARKTASSTPQSEVRNKKEKNGNEQKESKDIPKTKTLRKNKKVNYAVDDDSGSGDEERESCYSKEKSNSESDAEFEEEKTYKAPVTCRQPPSKSKKCKTSPTSEAKKSVSDVEMNNDDDEFEIITSKPRINRRRSSRSSQEGKSPVQMISDDSDEGVTTKKNKIDVWVEVYLPTSKSWWCVDLVSYSINQPEMCEKYASKPLIYVIAYNNENSVKDITERYASDWLSKTKKLRTDVDWWQDTLLPYKTRKKKMDEMEDSQLLALHQEKPLPQSITEYKNHPLYVLKRHLLKFEAIYPETATTLGFVRGEAVYSKDCVHPLHTREKWMSTEGRVVKQGEEPYKIVKGRMKRNQQGVDPSTITTDLFGYWQTEEYKPPPVKDGKVPRNEYGNVELFRPSMLPPGSKHIQIPGIQKIAKKLGIDGAPAVVGFDFHCGFCHPVIDGLVVAKESVTTLMDAWRQEQEAAKTRKEEKREKRVLGYWKLFVRSLLIRERLKRKYNSQESRTSSEQSGEKLEDEKISSIAISWPQNMKQGQTSLMDDGHCHVFPKRLHKKDKINGEWTKSCSCGFTLPLDK